jgi:CheY-like chemotaxis protein
VKRILVVEDNEENRRYMVYVLSHLGFDTAEAVDGADGLAQATANEFDIIFLDLQMPKLDGFEVLRRLRQQRPERCTPVVAVTAFAMAGDRENGLAAGFDEYLTKPLRPHELIAAVDALVG